jgi:hypothetical protein
VVFGLYVLALVQEKEEENEKRKRAPVKTGDGK